MRQSTTHPVASKPKGRFRFGLRGLIGAVLFVGLALGLIAREDRRVKNQSAVIAEMRRMGVVEGGHEPTILALIAMKWFSTDSRSIEARFSGWIDTGWLYRVGWFSGGRLKEGQIPAVVERLRRLGAVREVYFHEPSRKGLRLFYIDRISFNRLGVSRYLYTFRDYPPASDGVLEPSLEVPGGPAVGQ
jgi:hypothetical protein